MAQILESLGWTLRNSKGSHQMWTKPGERNLTIKVEKAVTGDLARRYERGRL